jgi:hypothetical protein
MKDTRFTRDCRTDQFGLVQVKVQHKKSGRRLLFTFPKSQDSIAWKEVEAKYAELEAVLLEGGGDE